MMYDEFHKHFRLFPKVFHTHFSSTAECLAFGVSLDVQRATTEAFRERPKKYSFYSIFE